MRGAQREITGLLIDRGYTPAGRWTQARTVGEDEDGVPTETGSGEYFRCFRPTKISDQG